MKKYLYMLFMPAFFQAAAQDENLLHSVGKKQFAKPSSTTMFVGGIEISTVPSINTATKDSNNTSAYTGFYLNYQHKSNFGLAVKAYVLPGGSNPGFYLTSISPYYANYSGTINPYISYTRYISHNNPAIPYSPIQNDIYAHIRIRTEIVDPIVGVDAGFGNDEQNNNQSVSDFNAFAAISRIFVTGSAAHKKEVFAIIPTLQLNAGTDRYFKFLRTTKYISQNRSPMQMGYGRGRNGGSQGTMQEQYIISEENNFRISNAEINLCMMYFIGNFSIEPSGSLYFPLRGSDRTVYGYWQLNLNYWIK
jgi:hypothetical protein